MDIGSSQGNALCSKVKDVVSHPCPGVTYFPLTILEKKTHPLCIACVAIKHAQASLADSISCEHCCVIPSRIREWHL